MRLNPLAQAEFPCGCEVQSMADFYVSHVSIPASSISCVYPHKIAQPAEAVEYTDCTSAEG